MNSFDNKKFSGCSIGNIWSVELSGNDSVLLTDENKNTHNIYMKYFLEFLLKNKLSLINNSFEFQMVISINQEFCTVKEFNQWNDTLKTNEKIKLDYNNLKVGYVYQADSLDDFYIYLGKKWIIKWVYNKKTQKIELSKPKQEHLIYETYKHNKFNIDQLYSKNLSYLKNKKLIKEISLYNNSKHNLETLIQYLIEDGNILYFDDIKPNNEYELVLEKVDIDYLYDLKTKYKISSKDIFNESKQCYILNSYFIFDEKNKESFEYSRRISKSKYNDVIFDKPISNEMKKINDISNSYYDYNNLLCRLTTKCENDYFRLAPDNYYILKLNF